MATATNFKDRFYKLFAADLTGNTFVECLLLADEAEAEIERLRAQLVEAIEDIESWGAYAEHYFKDKWDSAGCVERHKARMKNLDTKQRDENHVQNP